MDFRSSTEVIRQNLIRKRFQVLIDRDRNNCMTTAINWEGDKHNVGEGRRLSQLNTQAPLSFNI